MTRPLLKVCGLRTADQARAVAALGVDALGVIAVPSSPRFVAPAERPQLFEAMAAGGARCRGVLVVADPSDEELQPLHAEGGHRIVQLHGAETPRRCRELRSRVPGLQWWKALRIRTPEDLDRAGDYAGAVDALLLDAWVPDQLGGSGQRLPLAWLREFRPELPWWLAGGITPERVATILNALQPHGLDVSSGVESAAGVKDLRRVEALVAAVSASTDPAGRGAGWMERQG
jgi:phosphoribosylanthranilate isomerase